MKPDIEALRKKYIDNPPEGMTSEDIRRMSEDDLLDMDYFVMPAFRGHFSVQGSAVGGLSYKAKKYPVGFPTRHQRRSSQQIRQAVFSFGDICCSTILFYGFHQEL